MGLFSELFDGIKDFLHPNIDEGFRILIQECEPELRKFCRIRGYDLNNISYEQKESIFFHRISIKIESIRKLYKDVDDARKQYPYGFNSLFLSLFSKPMADDNTILPTRKLDAENYVKRDCLGHIVPKKAPFFYSSYHTYTKDLVNRYYWLLYNDGEFSKYIYEGEPSFSNFKEHISRIFRIEEIPKKINDLSLEHVRLLYSHLYQLPELQESALLQKKYENEIDKNPLRKKYLTQFLSNLGVEFDNKRYLISHIPQLDSFIAEQLHNECKKIQRYYPDGYAYYCRHNRAYDFSKIVESKEYIRTCNQYGSLCEPYDNWEKEQAGFTDWCKSSLSGNGGTLIDTETLINPHFRRLLINGEIGDLEYKVSLCSVFPICSDSSLDYSVLQGFKNYYSAYQKASDGYYSTICAPQYYSALESFITLLGKTYSHSVLVIILPSENGTLNTQEFTSVRQRCIETPVHFIDLSGKDKSGSIDFWNDITTFTHILLLDSFPNRSSVERVMSLISEIDDYHPTVFALSSMYSVGAEYMKERIAKRKEEIELERKKKEEQIRRLERERIEREKRIAEERIRQEKTRREREEERRLYDLSHRKKDSAYQITEYLERNGVRYFYHFTDKSNLASIKQNGGLYSWYYCREKSISISKSGGDLKSRSLDTRFGLQDYVRLSFCDDHPMAYRLQQQGYDLAYLLIKIDVAALDQTLFSDENATSSSHRHGPSFDDLKRVDLVATRKQYVSRRDPAFSKHQAEVMVKTFIPLEYIVNLKDYADWL